jgi:hypothetical protein
MMHFWNNLHQVHSKSRLESQIIFKSCRESKPKGLNGIAIIGYGCLCLEQAMFLSIGYGCLCLQQAMFLSIGYGCLCLEQAMFLSVNLYRLCKLGIFWEKTTFKSSLKLLNQIWPEWSLVGPLFCVWPSHPPFKMAALPKYRYSLIVYCCFVIGQNGLKF